MHSTRYGRQRNYSRASSAPTRLSRIADSQGAFRLASRAEKLKRPAKLWLWAPRRAVRGALTHEAFFDLPSLSPPCKQSRESFTIAGGSGDWQTLALVLSIIATTSFCFASVRTGSPKSGCKFHRSHFGSRYKLGCCGHAGLFAAWFDSCWTRLAYCEWCVQGTICVLFKTFVSFGFPGRRPTSKELGLMLTSWVNK